MNEPSPLSGKEKAKALAGVILLILFVGAVGTLIWDVTQSGEQPVQYETMTVVGFGMGSNYTGSSPIIRVEDAQGLEHQVPAPADIGESCEAGDKVAIIRQGISLRVGPEACSGMPAPS